MVRKGFVLGAALVVLLVLLWATGGVVAGPPLEGPQGGGCLNRRHGGQQVQLPGRAEGERQPGDRQPGYDLPPLFR